MKRSLSASFLIVSVMGMLWAGAGTAQEYVLKEYMPQAVGSTWTMKSSGGREEGTSTVEVTDTLDVGGELVPMMLTKNADGVARRGSLEMVTEDKLVLYGMIWGGRGDNEGQLTTMLYDPPAEFPGKLTVGQSEKATYKMKMRDREFEITMTLELEAIEDVTVPKGTFEGCLKLVYTSETARGERKRTAWYAKGVGAVKTERPGFRDRPATVTELVEYELAE